MTNKMKEIKEPCYRVTIADTDLSFETDGNDSILSSLLRAGFGMPYECNSGGCGSCKVTLIEGEISNDIETPSGLKAPDIRKNKKLACLSHAKSNCTISVKLNSAYEPAILPEKVTAKFVSREPLTPDLWEFRFKSDTPAQFLPGQYAKLHIQGVPGSRSYSMANTANDAGLWTFQIKRVPDGVATTVLFDEDLEGKSIVIDAPYSIGHLDTNSSRNIVCIAGGSGLAPMLSVIRGIAEWKGVADEAMLYYGARSTVDVIDPDLFSSINGFDSEKQYVPVISKADPSSKWNGPTGFIHEYLATALPSDCSNIDFYMAGPPPMVDAVRRLLVLDLQVPIDQLHYDRFF